MILPIQKHEEKSIRKVTHVSPILRRLGRRRVNWTIQFPKNLIGKLAYQNA